MASVNTNGRFQRFTPCLWFDDQAEEAAKFYTSVFKNSRIVSTTHYLGSTGEVSGKPAGSVMTVTFELEGQAFMGLNGGPEFTFSEAISFSVNCETQEEIDTYWEKLTADGGEEGPCGWLKDKFGVSWQVVPVGMDEMLNDPDPAKAERAMQAVLQMGKLEIEGIRRAAEATAS